jgi:hypothetical protein
MQLPKGLKDRLAKEFRFAATKMAETQNFQRKLYYYSAFFGEASRVLNQSWDSELALLHLVIQSSHRLINARVSAFASGADRIIDLPDNLPEVLDEIAGALADAFAGPQVSSEEIYKIMQRIADLAYVTTGNGYYLYARGTLKI